MQSCHTCEGYKGCRFFQALERFVDIGAVDPLPVIESEVEALTKDFAQAIGSRCFLYEPAGANVNESVNDGVHADCTG